MTQFDKFTERARRVLMFSQEEAVRLNHDSIRTEHLALGLLREQQGIGARALANMGVQLTSFQAAIEQAVERGEAEVVGEIALAPPAKKVLELAVDESRRLQHDHVGTHHLLLGLVREEEGLAAGALARLGVTLEKARAQVRRLLNESKSGDGESPP